VLSPASPPAIPAEIVARALTVCFCSSLSFDGSFTVRIEHTRDGFRRQLARGRTRGTCRCTVTLDCRHGTAQNGMGHHLRFIAQVGTVTDTVRLTHSPVAPFIRHVYYSLLFS